MLALDPDVDRIESRRHIVGGPNRWPLALWLQHLPDCNTAGHPRLTCTCGLLRMLEQHEAYPDVARLRSWLAFKGHVGHHGHCGWPQGEICVCGLHSAFPDLFRS